MPDSPIVGCRQRSSPAHTPHACLQVGGESWEANQPNIDETAIRSATSTLPSRRHSVSEHTPTTFVLMTDEGLGRTRPTSATDRLRPRLLFRRLQTRYPALRMTLARIIPRVRLRFPGQGVIYRERSHGRCKLSRGRPRWSKDWAGWPVGVRPAGLSGGRSRSGTRERGERARLGGRRAVFEADSSRR